MPVSGLKQVSCKINGASPLLFSNVEAADPGNPIVGFKKLLTGKRKKNEDDLERIAAVEWLLSGYWDSIESDSSIEESVEGVKFSGYSVPFVPARCIKASIREAGKTYKLGNAVKQSLTMETVSRLNYEGPTDAWEMWKARNYDYRSMVTVNQSKLVKHRVLISLPWSLDFSCLVVSDKLDVDQLIDLIKLAGRLTALCDYRPDFGKFVLDEVQVSDVKL